MNLELSEEKIELFFEELDNLHYSDITIEFFNSDVYKKIVNGELMIDI